MPPVDWTASGRRERQAVVSCTSYVRDCDCRGTMGAAQDTAGGGYACVPVAGALDVTKRRVPSINANGEGTRAPLPLRETTRADSARARKGGDRAKKGRGRGGGGTRLSSEEGLLSRVPALRPENRVRKSADADIAGGGVFFFEAAHLCLAYDRRAGGETRLGDLVGPAAAASLSRSCKSSCAMREYQPTASLVLPHGGGERLIGRRRCYRW